MKRKLLIIFLCLLLQGCAGWSKKDKAWLATMTTLNIIDGVQTIEILNNPDKYERNPLMQSNESVMIVKGVGNIGLYLLADKYEKYRTPILQIGTIVLGGCVVWNLTID